MTNSTTFHALYQGEHGASDGDAALVAVFSSASRAVDFKTVLSAAHTALKLVNNDLMNERLPYEKIPDLYWDIRPTVFNPRDETEV